MLFASSVRWWKIFRWNSRKTYFRSCRVIDDQSGVYVLIGARNDQNQPIKPLQPQTNNPKYVHARAAID